MLRKIPRVQALNQQVSRHRAGGMSEQGLDVMWQKSSGESLSGRCEEMGAAPAPHGTVVSIPTRYRTKHSTEAGVVLRMA